MAGGSYVTMAADSYATMAGLVLWQTHEINVDAHLKRTPTDRPIFYTLNHRDVSTALFTAANMLASTYSKCTHCRYPRKSSRQLDKADEMGARREKADFWSPLFRLHGNRGEAVIASTKYHDKSYELAFTLF
ncbi:unnamed protein product [Toxocara canis]|uniref:PlsC domain-containing protein n=1 Tax=Toxocara canis TaxID=6265 RepID=A0A183V2E7_TOXCA|nr:unnamed protein product [Toxocara canis]